MVEGTGVKYSTVDGKLYDLWRTGGGLEDRGAATRYRHFLLWRNGVRFGSIVAVTSTSCRLLTIRVEIHSLLVDTSSFGTSLLRRMVLARIGLCSTTSRNMGIGLGLRSISGKLLRQL